MSSHVASSVAVLILVIGLVVLLRHRGLVKEEHGQLFAKLVTTCSLPALIFTSLSRQEVLWGETWLAVFIFLAEAVCLALGWLLARMLGLKGPQRGAFMLTAAYGSSAMLGYPLISQVYPGNVAAMAEAVFISELGVGASLFTIGVMVAMYYGGAAQDKTGRRRAALGFFWSPIFAALVLGVACSVVGLPKDWPALNTLMRVLDVLGGANTFLVALTVGAALRFEGLREVAAAAAVICAVKLVVKPVMLWLPSLALPLMEWQRQVLVLEGAMPAAMLSVALSARYGCDARLASRLVLATTLLSVVSVPLIFGALD